MQTNFQNLNEDQDKIFPGTPVHSVEPVAKSDDDDDDQDNDEKTDADDDETIEPVDPDDNSDYDTPDNFPDDLPTVQIEPNAEDDDK